MPDTTQLISINVVSQLPIKLTTSNYTSYRVQFHSIFFGYNLHGFLMTLFLAHHHHYCHAPRPTPRAWRSFHTSNQKTYSVTWPKQLSCNRKLPIIKFLFRVVEQNLKSSKFNFKTKTSTIQNPLSKYLQT